MAENRWAVRVGGGQVNFLATDEVNILIKN